MEVVGANIAAPPPSPAAFPSGTHRRPFQSEGSYNWFDPAPNVPWNPSPWGKVQVPYLALGA